MQYVTLVNGIPVSEHELRQALAHIEEMKLDDSKPRFLHGDVVANDNRSLVYMVIDKDHLQNKLAQANKFGHSIALCLWGRCTGDFHTHSIRVGQKDGTNGWTKIGRIGDCRI
jgi:hypothetical protein